MQPDSLETGPGFTCFVDIKQNVKLHLQIATIVHIGHILGYKKFLFNSFNLIQILSFFFFK